MKSEGPESMSSKVAGGGVDSEMDRVGSKLLFENERVRIWELKLEPGETGNLHRHALDYVLVQIEGDRMAVVPDESSRGEYAEYMEADVVPGQYFWIEKGGVERARNVGASAYHEILVELKD
jgi:quercetin dioxygenase-like cupin family protein